MPRRQLADALVDGARRRHVQAGEELRQRVGVHRKVDARVCLQRMDLRGEGQMAAIELGVDQGLYAQTVAAQQQLAALAVPKGEGEHADQPGDAPGARAPEQVEQHLGVAGGAETVPLRFQLGPQFAVVVDLSVVDQHIAPAVGHHGLGAAVAEVDHLEPGVGEAQAAFGVHPLSVGVRAPVAQTGLRFGQELGRTSGAAGDAAHGFSTPGACRTRPPGTSRSAPSGPGPASRE